MQAMTHVKFPGPPGFHLPGHGDPIKDPNDLDASNNKKPPKHNGAEEIRHLNQYMGYFTTPEGDVPVSVVADSIKEAAKILQMPGVYGEDTTEPSTIKLVKGRIAVSVPVRMSGFRVRINPKGAEESGAYATPAHADVKNGTEVIFTAHEPFAWKFRGWYKNGQLLSTAKVSTIEVYDPYSSLIEYEARYDFDPQLRNGRYLELGHGWYFDFKFDGWAADDMGNPFKGKVVTYMNYSPGLYYDPKTIPVPGGAPHENPPPRSEWLPTADYHYVINDYVVMEDGRSRLTLIANPSMVQDPVGCGMTLILTPSAIGFNLAVEHIQVDNPFGIIAGQQLALKWVGDHNKLMNNL